MVFGKKNTTSDLDSQMSQKKVSQVQRYNYKHSDADKSHRGSAAGGVTNLLREQKSSWPRLHMYVIQLNQMGPGTETMESQFLIKRFQTDWYENGKTV